MGPRSGLSKLSKKEVNGVNIIKTCRDISQPSEPFALRFSSNLMVGVTRVYSQQYNFYYSADVNSTWIRLKRDLAVVQSENLDMAHPEAKLNVITCDYDLQIEKDLIRPLKLFQDLELEVVRGSRGIEVAVEFGWAPSSTLELGVGGGPLDNSSSSTDLLMLNVNDELRRNITLDERSGLGSNQTSTEPFSLSDDVLMVEDNGFYIDAEGNVVDYLPEGFLVEDDAQVPTTHEPVEALGKRKRNDVDFAVLATTVDQEKQFVPTIRDDFEGLPFDSHEQQLEFEVSTVKKKPRTEGRQRKPTGLVIDHNTMLSREELLDLRDNFLRNQENLHCEREAKQATACAKALIDRLLAHPLSVSNVGPDLISFWSTAGAHTWADRDATRGMDEENYPTLSALDSIFDDGTPFPLGAKEVAYMEEEPFELEIRRRQQSSDSMSTPIGMSAGDFKLGGMSSGHHLDRMPWSMEVHGSLQSASASDNRSQDMDSALMQASEKPPLRRRATSLGSVSSADSALRWDLNEDPLTRRRRTLTGISRSPSRERSGHSTGASRKRGNEEDGDGGPSSSADAHDMPMNIQDLLDLDGHRDEELGQTQARLAYEQEAYNFLEYVRGRLKRDNVHSVSFDGLISVLRRRSVAASAFHHVLRS
ncbi:hypothetical protein BGZ67_004713 [Mortierella alpina]|nr:hypothetical protein BGZ67_004713 [Mortierella alpina]